MRTLLRSAALLAVVASPAFAAAEAEGPVNLLKPEWGLMFWTLIIFGAFAFVITKFAIGPLTQAVAAREAVLREALESAQTDRAEAQRLLAEQKAQLDAARAEAQKFIADGRATAEKMREDMLTETKQQQEELLARARRDIEAEKAKAIVELRKEAVDLALIGAGKVIGKNLDDATNRRLVDEFIASVAQAR
jgi:F-type H+-transporting ATPase subunit b